MNPNETPLGVLAFLALFAAAVAVAHYGPTAVRRLIHRLAGPNYWTVRSTRGGAGPARRIASRGDPSTRSIGPRPRQSARVGPERPQRAAMTANRRHAHTLNLNRSPSMKPTTITIPVTITPTIDAAGIVELAELARFIVARLTDEGALDDVAEHAHEAMAVSAAVEWAQARLEAPVESVLEPAPNAGIVGALYGAGETLEQLDRTGELDRAAGLEDVSR